MALYYNLSKVYLLSENDEAFVKQILNVFLEEVPQSIKQIDIGIKNKDYTLAYANSHKIKPTLDLLGMTIAYDDILQIELWTKEQGKRKEIANTFQNAQSHIEKAIKEIKKDFNL